MTEIDILKQAAKYVEENIIIAWQAQGHHMSGAFEDSLINEMVNDKEIEGKAKTYGVIVNYGIDAGNIPYGGQTTGAKTSQYIQGLYNFFKAKGKSHKDALSFAFATAKMQKKEGMSTQASRFYSSTGERQNFLQHAMDAISVYLDNMIFDGLNDVVDETANELETQYV